MPLTLWTNWRTDRKEILQTFYIFEFYHKIKLLFVFDCFDLEIFHPENEKVRSEFTIQEHKYRFKKKNSLFKQSQNNNKLSKTIQFYFKYSKS